VAVTVPHARQQQQQLRRRVLQAPDGELLQPNQRTEATGYLARSEHSGRCVIHVILLLLVSAIGVQDRWLLSEVHQQHMWPPTQIYLLGISCIWLPSQLYQPCLSTCRIYLQQQTGWHSVLLLPVWKMSRSVMRTLNPPPDTAAVALHGTAGIVCVLLSAAAEPCAVTQHA